MIVVYVVMILFLVGIFAYGYLTVDWEAILSGQCEFPEIVCSGLETLGFPSAWLTYRNVIWRCIVPLFGITTIFYGFVSKLNFFSRSINIILSFVVSLSTVPLGAFVVFVAVLFAVMGIYTVILFFALAVMAFSLAFIGTARLKAGGKIFHEMDKQVQKISKTESYYGKEISESEKKINDINKKMAAGKIAPDVGASMILQEERRITECKQMITTAKERIKQIKDQEKDIQEDIQKE
jgi:chaperonin cofactor prefoldin